MFEAIKRRNISFPRDMHPDAVDLIDKLCDLNPVERLGIDKDGVNYGAIKSHPFFKGHIDFEQLSAGKIRPPLPMDLIEKAYEKQRIEDE